METNRAETEKNWRKKAERKGGFLKRRQKEKTEIAREEQILRDNEKKRSTENTTEEQNQEKDAEQMEKNWTTKGEKKVGQPNRRCFSPLRCCLPFLSLSPFVSFSKIFKQTERQSHETQTAQTTSKRIFRQCNILRKM